MRLMVIAGKLIFSFDSKGPNESLDNHLRQLLAYCISAGTNLVAVTNGIEFRVYNANELIFCANDIEALDLQFSELQKLLHKDFKHLSVTERIRSINDDIAMGRDKDAIESLQRTRIAVQNSDLFPYLNSIIEASNELTLPFRYFRCVSKFKSLKIFRLKSYILFLVFKPGFDLKPNEPRTYNHIVPEVQNSSTLIVGESGIGKTSLLMQIAREYSISCLRYDSAKIPVLVRLSEYTNTNNLRLLISNRLRRGGTTVSEVEVIDLLQKRSFDLVVRCIR
ncbi:MAG: ATP-binding protein [Caldilineaceae bacterium]